MARKAQAHIAIAVNGNPDQCLVISLTSPDVPQAGLAALVSQVRDIELRATFEQLVRDVRAGKV